MDAHQRGILCSAAKRYGTPLYLYIFGDIENRIAELNRLFGGRFDLSYAVKANPNIAILRELGGRVASYDVSSFGEVERVLKAGSAPERISFSGPGKREEEIRRAVELDIGELVCESLAQTVIAADHARRLGRQIPILLRLNPLHAPKGFGVNMAGRPSQFGIDEEESEDVIHAVLRQQHTKLIGFHIYSGTNCLNEDAIIENISLCRDLFDRACVAADLRPQKLIFGSGFGIPYLPADKDLDVGAIAAAVNPQLDAMRRNPRYEKTRFSLELGRWIIGQAGYLLTSVIGEKASRGTNFAICDAGFNNQLSACGMMGSVIRRNWRIETTSAPETANADLQPYTVVGPLCTSIDVIATNINLPRLRVGEVLAIEGSGAYGLTASPTRFISHPEPREILVTSTGEFLDVSESLLNHWSNPAAMPLPS
jgi:diaminopimelate decarboxylase